MTREEELDFKSNGSWSEAVIINSKTGSTALSQYFFCLNNGQSPIRSFGNSDVVMFVLDGEGDVLISGKLFPISREFGIYVKPKEAISFINHNKQPIKIIATVCPEEGSARWLEAMPENFDSRNRKRTVSVSERSKTATGDRFYQLLVGKKMGSHQTTQFIGSIPLSKAPEHFHLYEEAITVLEGEGYMWAGQSKAEVGPGSLIFLPKKQPHCLECTVEGGLKLMGTFYPAGSPTVSYSSE